MKKALWIGLTLIVGTGFILLLGVSLVLGTERGRLFAAAKAIEFAQSDTLSITLEKLSTPTLGAWEFDSIHIQRHGATWLELRQGKLKWQPGSLLRSDIEIDVLSIDTVYFNTDIPNTKSKIETKEENASTGNLPKLPTIGLMHFFIGKLDIDGIPLSDNMQLPDYRIEGSARLFDEHPVLMQLTIASLANQKNRFDIQSVIEDGTTVTLKGALYDTPSGLIHTLLKLPSGQAVNAQFDIEVAQKPDHIDIGVNTLSFPLGKNKIDHRGTIQLYTEPLSVKVPAWIFMTDQQAHHLKGEYNQQDLWANVDLNTFPLSVASPWVEALESGSLDMEANISWIHGLSNIHNKNLPDVKGQLNIKSVYKKQPIQASGFVDFTYPSIKLVDTQIDVGKMHINAEGTLDFEQPNTAIVISAKQIDTAPLRQLGVPIPDYLQVQAKQLNANITGALKNPVIALKTLATGQIHDADFTLATELNASPEKAKIKQLELTSLEADIDLVGTVDWSGNSNDFTARYNNLNQQFITLAQKFSTFAFPNDIQFSAQGETRLQGRMKRPKIQTQTRVAGHYRRLGDDLPFVLDTEGSAIVGDIHTFRTDLEKVTLTIFDKPTLTASGKFTAEDMNLDLELNRLPTQTLSLFGLPNIQGQAYADLALTGSMDRPNVSGFFNYQESIQLKKRAINLNWRADLHTNAERQLSLKSTLTENQISAGTMTVQLPLDEYLPALREGRPLPLAGNIQGTQDLRIARWFIDPLIHPMGGKLGADIVLTGTVKDPQINGQLRLSDGHYAHTIAGVQLDRVTLKAAMRGKNMIIESATARTGGEGKLSLSGQVNLDGQALLTPNPIRLTLRARDATIVEQPGLQAQLSGEARVEGNLDNLYIEGDLDFTPLTINIDQLSHSGVPEIKVSEVGSDKNKPDDKPMSPIVHLDLKLTANQQAFIRGRGLDAELGGNIRVKGTVSDPQYVGRFETLRGKMDLLTRRFMLQDGEVRFSNEAMAMRIPAVYTDKNIEIRMELYGTPDNPQLKLSSIPDLPQDEILSRLIFGESVTEVSPFQAIRLAAAARTLSQGGSFDPIDSTRDKLGLDAISIENETGDNGESGVAVGVGKYINERVYLEVERSPNPSQPWSASVEIELTPKVTLESTTGTRGKVNTKLLWTNDY